MRIDPRDTKNTASDWLQGLATRFGKNIWPQGLAKRFGQWALNHSLLVEYERIILTAVSSTEH